MRADEIGDALIQTKDLAPGELPCGLEPLYATRRRAHRTLWVSDVHLGTRGCKAAALTAFLSAHQAERIYLVGDVLDGWKLGRGWYWDDAQTHLVHRLIDLVERGTDVIYVPGNHDELLRRFGRVVVAGVRVKAHAVHALADGRRALVIHGDQFDGVVNHHRWLALLGDHAYGLALALNDALNGLRRRMGRAPWSISAYLKQRVKDAVRYVAAFESALVREAVRHGVDAVICGHVHKAELRTIDGVLYANDGDWVESCTALAEGFDGRLELLEWRGGEARTLAREPAPPAGQRVSRPAAKVVSRTSAPASSQKDQTPSQSPFA